jgi:hypothetical protein
VASASAVCRAMMPLLLLAAGCSASISRLSRHDASATAGGPAYPWPRPDNTSMPHAPYVQLPAKPGSSISISCPLREGASAAAGRPAVLAPPPLQNTHTPAELTMHTPALAPGSDISIRCLLCYDACAAAADRPAGDPPHTHTHTTPSSHSPYTQLL